MNSADVRVPESGQGTRLLLQTLPEQRVSCSGSGEYLQCYCAAENLVVSFVDLAHSARSEQTGYLKPFTEHLFPARL